MSPCNLLRDLFPFRNEDMDRGCPGIITLEVAHDPRKADPCVRRLRLIRCLAKLPDKFFDLDDSVPRRMM